MTQKEKAKLYDELLQSYFEFKELIQKEYIYKEWSNSKTNFVKGFITALQAVDALISRDVPEFKLEEVYSDAEKFYARMSEVRKMIELQSQNGQWNQNQSMCDLYNGMELVVAALESRNPELKQLPPPDPMNRGVPFEM